ncbi:MAG: adenylyltransferase/cytidyltransferase family protein [Candidatus Dojkabacteria bacterium]|nr:MAG: adenylyltransferase/cytidyltransferase family protein [Candidatus Dojkabacteria bacterium]
MIKNHTEFSLDTICSISHDLRKNGKTVAFTHGAFDLFHIGHLTLLEDTKKAADFLIVMVECDKNVTSYKKYPRPIISEEHRVGIVGNCECVNIAFVNNEPMGKDLYTLLYREIKPSFVAIGREYGYADAIEEQTSRADIMLRRFTRRQKAFTSTTEIIDRIVQSHRD